MLPLFGRTIKRLEVEEIGGDDWCIPTDQELTGTGRIITADIESVIATVNEESSELETSADTIADIESASDIVNKESSNLETEMNESSSFFDESKMIFNDIDTINESDFSSTEITMIDSEEYPTEDTFVKVSSEFDDLCIEDENSIAIEAILKKIKELESKYEELNLKVEKIAEDSLNLKIEHGNEFNASNFANEVIEIVKQVMKNGISYQQKFVGKFIDELDNLFDIDMKKFDPFK